MRYIKTMAVQINETTYSLAVACLPGGFATIPFSKVVGCFLVINDLEITHEHKNEAHPIAAFGNSWMSEAHFRGKYRPVTSSVAWTLFEVEKI